MPLIAGSAKAGTGLAGAMAEKLEESLKDGFDKKLAAPVLDALAEAVVDYVKDNLNVDTSSNPAGIS